MTDSTKIRWGVISTAKIGREQVIPAIRASRNGHVAAIASRELSKAKALADSIGAERAYDSYEAMLADPNIDAVYNPLPNHGHAPWAVAAMRAGKHVLVEKPMALNAAEAQAMVEESHATGMYLAEAFMYRFHPQHARAREIIASGALGPLTAIDASFSFSLPHSDSTNVRLAPNMGGGGLWDVGCYCVNGIRWLSGKEPDAVSGFAAYGASGVDEVFVGALHFADGLLAHFECGLRSFGRQQYTVTGEKGRLNVAEAFRPDDHPGTVQVFRKDHDEPETIAIPATNQYVLMVEDFADAILNKRPPRFAPEDGVQNMRVLDALAQAAREHRTVTL
ncbi:MAG: Gfo/Idh/MocA family protein [Aggregatilineales bacterium]